MTHHQLDALRLAECLEDLRYTTKQQADESAAKLREQHAEIERLRAELEALHKQEPVANIDIWHNHGLENTNVDYWGSLPKGSHMLYSAAGAQPATPSTQITPNWIWSWLMDWCKRRGVPPSNYDSLFQMASEAILLAAGTQPASTALWISLADRMPDPDKHDRVLIYTEGYDFGGEQVFDVKAETLNECRYASPDEQPETCKAASHWMLHPRDVMRVIAGDRAAPEAPKSRPLTDAMVEAAGRALSDRHANGCGCGMDKDIMWSSYSDEFKEQARVALEAAHGIGDEA